MKGSLTILIVSLSLVEWTDAVAQDPVFSQFYSSGLYLNPALAGVESETFFGANYRSQWSSLSLPFNTFQASFIQPMFTRGVRKRHLGGFGATMLNDVAGPNKEFTTQALTVTGAWNIQLDRSGKHVISMALQGGAGQQRVSYDNLRWTSQYSEPGGYDPSLPGEASMSNIRVFRPLINTGFVWSYNPKKSGSSKNGISIYNGIAINNLARSKSYFPGAAGDRSTIVKIHGGVTVPVSRQLEISPNYLVVAQGSNKQINIGTYAGYSIGTVGAIKIIAGTWYRINDGLIFSAGIASKKINFGFSYDNNVASMGKTFGSTGAYEFSVSYRVPGKNNLRRISSPLI